MRDTATLNEEERGLAADLPSTNDDDTALADFLRIENELGSVFLAIAKEPCRTAELLAHW